jgi:hypothetical protein
MFAYGVFFDRFGDEPKIDYEVTQVQCVQIFNDEDDVLSKDITSFAVESGIRNEFGDIDTLIMKAAKGKPLVIDGEEWLFAIAGTKAEARLRFLEAYAAETESDFD